VISAQGQILPEGKLDKTHYDSPVQLRKKRGCHLIRADSVYVRRVMTGNMLRKPVR